MGEAGRQIKAEDLQRWRLVERFQRELEEVCREDEQLGATWADPRRKLAVGQYLGLYLFGLFNPVVTTMRGLCAASDLERVQREVSGGPVSLGSFSEAQALVKPELLEAVFARLGGASGEPEGPVVIDRTLWRVLPRMSWAFWRRQGGLDNAVRLHVEFDLARGEASRVELTKAKVCERAQWQKWARRGLCYIADRYYSYDYALLAELQAREVDFVVRLRVNVQWVEEAQEELTAADRLAGVTRATLVRLGCEGRGPRVRVIEVLAENETILLATTLPAADVSAELLAVMYRHRWQVELFFRWLKCILGCRHWLAESPRGVALQAYLALIAAQLLVMYTGTRPNRRQMEAIQFYLMGWASVEELLTKFSYTPAQKN